VTPLPTGAALGLPGRPGRGRGRAGQWPGYLLESEHAVQLAYEQGLALHAAYERGVEAGREQERCRREHN
jgi:hypothetical protein